MKKNEIKIGGLYVAKVSDKLVTVRIDSANTRGGWNGTNTATGKSIRIKSAQRLRSAAKGAAKAEKPEATAAGASDAKPEAEAATPAKKARTKKAADAKPKRVSALDAAAQVLAKAGTPMRAQDLIVAMGEQGLWKSPAGKTPHATLYAAMMREARDKGSSARFKKVDRGQFAHNG